MLVMCLGIPAGGFKMSQHFSQDDVELLQCDSVYQGFFELKAYRLKHRLYAGGWSETIERELLERGDAVGVLLYDPDREQLALVEQFRIGPYVRGEQPWSLEMVAGVLELGESPESVARRESEEEAGCIISRIERIAEYYSSPGGSSERFTLFCGKVSTDGVGGIHGLDSEAEDIRVTVYSLDDAFHLLAEGRINNAHTLIGLQWLQLHHARIKTLWTD